MRTRDRTVGAAVRRGVAAAGLATSLLHPRSVQAEVNVFADAAVVLGYTWGAGGGFTWGIEGRLGSIFGDEWDLQCGQVQPSVAGTLRAQNIELARPRLGVGLQMGAVAGPTSLAAEIGAGYRWGEHGGL